MKVVKMVDDALMVKLDESDWEQLEARCGSMNTTTETVWCHRHQEVSRSQSECVWCDRCEEVRQAGLCVECEKHKATENFAESTMDAVHGFTVRLCRCCQYQRVAKLLKDIQEQERFLREDLEGKPCD